MTASRTLRPGSSGSRINRKEDPRLLTGRGPYVDDVVVPGMLHVAFARSDIARGPDRRRSTRLRRGAPRAWSPCSPRPTSTTSSPARWGRRRRSATAPRRAVQGAGRRRGALRRRPVRHGRRREPRPRRGRSRAHRARRRAAARRSPTTPRRSRAASSCTPTSSSNRAGGMPLPIDDELRADLRRRARTSSPRPSSRTGTSRCRWRPGASSRRGTGQRASFDVWVSTQSPHDVRTVTARITGVPESQIRVPDGRRRWRVRAEGLPGP